MEFPGIPLIDILNHIKEEHNLPIAIDMAGLDELAISPDTEIEVSYANMSLRSALNLMLKQPGLEDLTFIIDNEVLLITTEERANESVQTHLYWIKDLQPKTIGSAAAHERSAEGRGRSSFQTRSPNTTLREAIIQCIESDSWMENGKGEGAIVQIEPGILIVSQTHRVHQEIKNFLEAIRTLREENMK